MVPRAVKSLNSIQLPGSGSRPFQDQRQTVNLMQMSHSHSSHAEGNFAEQENPRGLQKQSISNNPRGTVPSSALKQQETASGSLKTWLQNWL